MSHTSRSLVLTLAIAALLPTAARAADPYSVTPLKVVAMVGPDNATACTVDADLYKPAGASPSARVPAILATNGFGGSKADFAKLAPSYAKRGYAFLAYSGLGFGASGCKIELDDPEWDGKAASAMIDFLGGGRAAKDGTTVDFVLQDATDHAGVAQPHDPRVGMIGGSYGGQVQFAAASVDKRLDTIIPQITWNDLAYSLAPNNTAATFGVTSPEPGVEKYQWVSLFFGIGIAGTGPSTQGSGDASHLGPCPNFDDKACQIKAQMDATGYADGPSMAFARHASVSSYINQVRIPTFLAQGEVDTLFNLNEAVATYNALRAQGTPVRMLWRSAGHSGGGLGTSEDNPDNPESAYASRAYLEWFDFYLRGIGDAPKLDFSYYRDWVKFPANADAAAAVVTAPAYPVAGDQRWYLSGTDALVSDQAAIQSGAPQFQFAAQTPTSYSETSALDQSRPVSDQQGTFAAFTSPVLTKDTDVVGIPRVTVSLDAPAQAAAQSQDPGGRLVVFAKLYELRSDGTQVLANRLISPVRVPDVTKPVAITLPGIAHRFEKGSKFQFVLAASDAAYKNNNLPGQVTVKVDPKAPSELTIPVIGEGAKAAPVAAPPGTQSPGAGQSSQVAAEGVRSSAGKLPKARRCKRNRRVITVRIVGVHKPDRIVSRKVTVNGKRVRIRHGRARINLRHRRAGSYRVFVLVKSRKGKVRRGARTYRVC